MNSGIFDSISSRIALISETEITDGTTPPEGLAEEANWSSDCDIGPPSAQGESPWPVNDDSWGHEREGTSMPEATHGIYEPYRPWQFENTPTSSKRFAAIPWDGKTVYGEYLGQYGRIIGLGLVAVGSGAYMLSQELQGAPHPAARLLGAAAGIVGGGLMVTGSLTTLTQTSVARSQNEGGVKKVVDGETYRCWADAVCDLTGLPNFLKF